MALPVVTSIAPTSGPAGGGELLRLVGTGFSSRVAVQLGGAVAAVVAVRSEAGSTVVDLRTPAHEAGVVAVRVENLDPAGRPIPGESVELLSAYRFARPPIAREADLTRVVRQLLRELKQQVLPNVSATVSVDYDDTVVDGLNVVALAKVPSLVLSGPALRPNRFYSTNTLHEEVVAGTRGPELLRRTPPYTADLVFTLTGASDRTAELFNLMAAVATFLHRNRWLKLARDPANESLGTVRWEMDAEGEFRTQLAGRDDVRAFSCGFAVRGFDIDEAMPFDLGKRVVDPQLETHTLSGRSL